jgi:C4-dicarboxylate transporter DctM subunit
MMTQPLVGLIGIAVLMVLLFLNMPVGFVLILLGFIGFAAVRSIEAALTNLGLVPLHLVADYNLAVFPLFLLMGTIVASAGISRDLFKSAYTWVGEQRGGLAMATILACAGFGAACGSSVAEAATMGKVVEPEMRRYKYDPSLAAGSVACGGTLAILIPPSMGFIMYALLTEQSIGRLFVAGIFPGILEAIFYLITIYILCQRNPRMGPPGPKTSFKAKLIALRESWPIMVLFVLVMGGIYAGIFTPTEAGAIGAFGALIIGLALRRLSRKSLINAFVETGQLTAMMLICFTGAMIFSSFIAASRLPFILAETIANLPLPGYLILVVILFIYILIGCFFDVITTLILTIPILFPVIISLGLDPIWFGVLTVRVTELGLVSPPFGMNCFVLKGVMNVPIGTIYRGVIPFCIADIIHIALLVAIPQISLFLPNTMIS